MRETIPASLLCSLVVVASLVAVACSDRAASRGEGIVITWGVIDNLDEEGPAHELVIENRGAAPLPATGWTLYFSSIRTIRAESLPASIRVEHINGDFFKLEPGTGFEPLAPGQSLRIPYRADWPAIRVSDSPAGFYFVFHDQAGNEVETVALGEPQVAPFTRLAQTQRNQQDQWLPPEPGQRYRDNPPTLPLEQIGRLLPAPVELRSGRGTLTLTLPVEIRCQEDLEPEAHYLAGALTPVLGAEPRVVVGAERDSSAIVLATSPLSVGGKQRGQGDEAYRLEIDPEQGIEITGSDGAGVLYGIQSLRALMPLRAAGEAGAVELAAVTVLDAPRFPYRGLHLDVARNFHGKETVLELLELMAFYKLNRLHLHLSDDEGWRLAIQDLPELVEVGSRRGHTLDERDHLVPSYGSGPEPGVPPGSGHYTRQDFIEILRHATARHIEVIPEIDLPGHARAAIVAMAARQARLAAAGQDQAAAEYLLGEAGDTSEYRSVQGWTGNVINVCQESTYRFLGHVMDDLVAIYDEAGAPLSTVHTGGDEVPHGAWQGSPACRQLLASREDLHGIESLPRYFLDRVSSMLAERDLVTAGWEEIGLHEQQVGEQLRKEPIPPPGGRRFQVYVWNSIWGGGYEDNAYKLANAGYPVVMCNASNLYFDMACDKDPQEPGFYWANMTTTRTTWELSPLDLFAGARSDLMGRDIDPARYARSERLSERGRRNLLGIQGQLWSETVKSAERLEYMIFPRLLALAERAWAAEPAWQAMDPGARREQLLVADWTGFANRVGHYELPRLDLLAGGVAYRIPLPGAVITDGILHANVELPGLSLRFTTDGSEPGPESTAYSEPVAVSGTVKLRAFTTSGRGSRTVTVSP
jgi:hexosaminidase